jgi:integrase
MQVDRSIVDQARKMAVATLDAGPAPRTIRDLCTRYLSTQVATYYTKSGRPTSTRHAIRAALDRLTAVAGDQPPQDMDCVALEQVRHVLALQKLARPTVNKYAGIVVQMFAWAAVRQWCPQDLPQRLRLLRPIRSGRHVLIGERPSVHSVPTPALKATLRGLKRASRCTRYPQRAQNALMLWTMIAVQLRTGMRPGELCSMRWSEISLDSSTWLYTPGVHKCQHHGIARQIWLGPDAQRAILNWSMHAGGDRIFPISRGSYRQKMLRWLERLRVHAWHPHQLRHNAATAIERRAGAKAAQLLLGHTSLKTTRGYIDPDVRQVQELMRRFG